MGCRVAGVGSLRGLSRWSSSREFCKLRGAEDNISYEVFGEGVDHSVVHCWEKRVRRL
ncbi:MAG: hypothetical protein QW756_00705 [Nitrososphaerota archaeon]